MADQTQAIPTHMRPRDYATRVGISYQGLRQVAMRLPMPWRTGEALVPVEAMDAAWTAAYKRGQVKFPLPESAGAPGTAADTRLSDRMELAKLEKAEGDARIAQLKAAKLEALLVPVEEVERTWARIAGSFAAMLASLPAKIAGALPGDARDNQRVVRDIIRAEQEALASRVEAEAEEEEAAAEAVDVVEAVETEEPDEPVGPVGPKTKTPAKTKAKTKATRKTPAKIPAKRGRPPKAKPRAS